MGEKKEEFDYKLIDKSVKIDNLGKYYITVKGGASKTLNTGETTIAYAPGLIFTYPNEDLGTGSVYRLSTGKYLTDCFRLELEAIKTAGYEFDGDPESKPSKSKIEIEAFFMNGIYDFQPFNKSNTVITPYLGGGVGISKNKMGKILEYSIDGVHDGFNIDSNTINQFAYKLSAGTLVSLTGGLSLDVNYQYVNLGEFEGGTRAVFGNGAETQYFRGIEGGEIKTHELTLGLIYSF